MKDQRFLRKLISIITVFLMLSGRVTGPVTLYAAQDIIPEGSSCLPVGAFDDETEIGNPEPLPEFVTGVTKQNRYDEPDYLNDHVAVDGAADYAVAYNSLDMGYLPDNGPINQGMSSLCWAFSSAIMAEISMIRKGLADKFSVRYSPDQTGYFFYNRINDPLGNTDGDNNTIINGLNYYNLGGNNSFNTWSLASWISMRDEADVPFTGSMYDSLPDDKAYSSTAHLQNAYWSSTYSADPQNIEYIENVKELIYNFGGVSMIVSSALHINENHAFYNTDGGGGHNVTVIGWDDSYPRENFTDTPPGDGAWYVRDSYDEMGNHDSNGCFWMSYYSRDISDSRSDKAIAYDFEAGDNYDHNYQYDGTAGNRYISSGKDSIQISNVFRAGGDEYLEAVAFAPASTSMSYEINVYKLAEDFTSPVGDVSLAKVTGDTRYVGYRTVKLDDPVALSRGDLFSVVVDAKDTSGDDNASIYVELSYQNSNWITFEGSVSEKQSYYYDYDLESTGGCARIKAFTDDAGTDPEHPEKKAAALARFADGDHSYDGTLHYPEVTVNKGEDGSGELLTEGEDYTVSCYNNKYAGEATVTLYSDKYRIKNASYTFNILPKSLAGVSVTGIEPAYDHTGADIKPEPDVTDPDMDGKKLVKNTDYTLEYKNNREAGNACVVIRGIGNYSGEIDKDFIISKAEPLKLSIAAVPKQTYIPGGVPVRPAIKVKHGNVVLNNLSDYSVSYSDNVNAGTAKVNVTGVNKTIYYNSSASISFVIKPFNIKEAVIGGISDRLYVDGKTYTVSPSVTVKAESTGESVTLKEGVDYKLSYKNNTKVRPGQKVTVYIEGINNYTGRVKKTFTLRKYIPMSDEETFEISLSQYEYEYDGTAKRPAVKVVYKPQNTVLTKGVDYKVTYLSNKNAGTAKVIVKPAKKLVTSAKVRGSAAVLYRIKGKNPKNVAFAAIKDKTYAGKPIEPKVIVYENGKKISPLYYYVEYNDNVNAGTAGFTVYGKKNYSGELGRGTFVIEKQQFSKVNTSYSRRTGILTVRYGNAVLRENFDYKKDPSNRLITSMGRNFEAGTKKY